MGCYSYVRSPMGISDIPATFNNIINQLIGHIEGVFTYADDVCLFSPTYEHHIKILKEVLHIFEKEGLTINPKKTEIAVKQIEFLGTIIDKDGIRPNPQNLGKVLNFELPQTSRKLKSFLGLASFLRRYIKNYAAISRILYDKTKGDKAFKLKWNDNMLEAYNKIKTAVQNAPPLGYADLNSKEPLVLVTDSSQQSCGYYLYQNQKCVATGKLVKKYLFFGGCNLDKNAQNKWPAWRCELYAILKACKRLHNWLRPKQFQIRTDNSACYYLLTRPIKKPIPYLARWLAQLQTLNYEVKHISGISSEVYLADFISRNNVIEKDTKETINLDIDHLIANVSVIPTPAKRMAERYQFNDVTADKISKSQDKDDFYNAIKLYLINHEFPTDKKMCSKIRQLNNDFMVVDGLLYHVVFNKNKEIWQQLCIPEEYINIIIKNCHDNLFLAAHTGIAKTLWRIKKVYWWPKMTAHIVNFVKSCTICLKANRQYQTKVPMTQRKINSIQPLDNLYCDIVQVPTPSQGNIAIFSIMCDFTKYLWATPIKNKRASTISKILFNEIILKYSLSPKRYIFCDSGPENISNITKQLFYLTGIKQNFCSFYHPQSNVVERNNQSILSLLRKFCQDEPSSWASMLPYVTLSYNSTLNETTGYTPISLLTGISVVDPIKYKIPDPPLDCCENTKTAHNLWRKKILTLRQVARKHSLDSKRIQKYQHDKRTKDHTLKTGDQVIMERSYLPVGADRKLTSKFDKMYKIVGWVGQNNAKLRSSSNGNLIKRSVHVSKLKKVTTRLPHTILRTQSSKRLVPNAHTDKTNINTTRKTLSTKRTRIKNRKDINKLHTHNTRAICRHSRVDHRNVNQPITTTVTGKPRTVRGDKQISFTSQKDKNKLSKVPVLDTIQEDVQDNHKKIHKQRERSNSVIDKIVAKRFVNDNEEYLCKWKGYNKKYNSWQSYKSLNKLARQYVKKHDIPLIKERTKSRKITRIQSIHKVHKKIIESNTDYISCNYNSNINIALPYVINNSSYQYDASSITEVLRFCIALWIEDLSKINEKSLDLNTDFTHTNRELYKHFLVIAIKLFMDKQETSRVKLLNTRGIPIYSVVDQIP